MSSIADRVDHAEAAVMAYAKNSGPEDEEVRTIMIDLFTDLRHLVDYYGLVYHELERLSHNHYCEEIQEEKQDA